MRKCKTETETSERWVREWECGGTSARVRYNAGNSHHVFLQLTFSHSWAAPRRHSPLSPSIIIPEALICFPCYFLLSPTRMRFTWAVPFIIFSCRVLTPRALTPLLLRPSFRTCYRQYTRVCRLNMKVVSCRTEQLWRNNMFEEIESRILATNRAYYRPLGHLYSRLETRKTNTLVTLIFSYAAETWTILK